MPSASTAGRLAGRLADWLKPATLQSRTNEPRDCPERNWSTGTGVVLPRSWIGRGRRGFTWTAGEIRRPTLHAARKVLHYKVQDTPQSVDPSLSLFSPFLRLPPLAPPPGILVSVFLYSFLAPTLLLPLLLLLFFPTRASLGFSSWAAIGRSRNA